MHCDSDLQWVLLSTAVSRLMMIGNIMSLWLAANCFSGDGRDYTTALRATLARKCCLSVKNTTPVARVFRLRPSSVREGRRRDEPKEIRSDLNFACLGLSLWFFARRKLKSELIYGIIVFAFRTMTVKHQSRANPSQSSGSAASQLRYELGKFMRLLFSINYRTFSNWRCFRALWRDRFGWSGWRRREREPLFLHFRCALSFASATEWVHWSNGAHTLISWRRAAPRICGLKRLEWASWLRNQRAARFRLLRLFSPFAPRSSSSSRCLSLSFDDFSSHKKAVNVAPSDFNESNRENAMFYTAFNRQRPSKNWEREKIKSFPFYDFLFPYIYCYSYSMRPSK